MKFCPSSGVALSQGLICSKRVHLGLSEVGCSHVRGGRSNYGPFETTSCTLPDLRLYRGSNFSNFIKFLAEVKQGRVGRVKVRLDRLQALISTSYIEHLEFGRGDEGFDRVLQHKLRYSP